MISVAFQPLIPAWLALLLAAVLAIAAAHGAWVMLRRGVGRAWLAALTVLRFAAAAVLALILLQPVVSSTRSEPSPPQALVLVDVSRSMNSTGDAPASTTELLRESPLRTALAERYTLDWYSFDRTARPVDERRLSALRSDGDATRVDDSLAAACSHALAHGARPARVVLVSNGQDRSSVDPVEIARRFQVKVDVLPSASAAAAETSRVSIDDVQGTQRVLLGSDTHMRVRLTRGGALDARTLQLIVQEEGRELFRRNVEFAAGQHEAIVEVVHRPTTAGSKHYEFQLAGQQQPQAYRHRVYVVDAKHEILVLEDTWRWEYRYLHRLLEDDPSFRFTAFLARGQGTYLQLGSPDRQVSLVGLPQDADDLAAFDLLVLGDIDPQRLSDELVAALRSAVADEGKSLVVIAGPRLGRIAAVPALHEMLPVELTPQSGEPVAGPIAVRWPAEARDSPLFFQFELPAEELPPLDHVYPAARRRAGATVLLEAAAERNAYGPQIVMAEHSFGHGRVLFIGTDTLWKWHTLAPDGPGLSPYSLFWQQALRALAPSRTGRGEAQLWLTANRTRAAVGRRVALRLEATSHRPLANARLESTITTPDGQRVPLVFHADALRPGHWQADFTPQVAGEHRVAASLIGDNSQPLAVSQLTIEVAEDADESSDSGVDLAALARLAAATGGNVINPNEPTTWPSETASPPMMERTHSYALWENFSLLVALCSLLGVDWLIRALRGLT